MAFKDSKPFSEVAQQQKLKVLNELHHLEDACHFCIHFAREDLISDFRSRQFFNHGRVSNSKKTLYTSKRIAVPNVILFYHRN